MSFLNGTVEKMRRHFLIYSAIALVSICSFLLIQGGTEPAFQEARVFGIAQTLPQERATKSQGEVDVSATPSPKIIQHTESSRNDTYAVVKVVDGDTLDVLIEGKVERLRLIGIDTPETVDPRKPVQCFGVGASNRAKALLTGKRVRLESDPTQGERDKYDRLLRYLFLPDGTNFNLLMIRDGYAYEYTYAVPYRYQTEFKSTQAEAMQAKAGLWGADCGTTSIPAMPLPISQSEGTVLNGCTIKGNINATQEKIYHVIGCQSYDKTVIIEDAGEKWFCSEWDALNAGWRKALNC
jgi:micrococcal nuclease